MQLTPTEKSILTSYDGQGQTPEAVRIIARKIWNSDECNGHGWGNPSVSPSVVELLQECGWTVTTPRDANRILFALAY